MNFIQKLARWYFTKRALPYWGVLIQDAVIVFASACVVNALGEGTVQSIWSWKALSLNALYVLLCYLVGFRLLHTYSGVIRYSSFVDLQRVCFANLIGLGLSELLCGFGFSALLGYIDLMAVFMMATLLMWMLRVVVKYIYDVAYISGRAKRGFIYGVKKGGVSLAKSIQNEEKSKYILAGFVTDDPEYVGKRLRGVRVVKNNMHLVEEMKLRQATVLLVSPLYSEKFRNDTKLIDSLIEENIHIHMMPSTVEWDGKSDLSYMSLKEVEIEDLLPREKIEIDMDKVGELLTDKCILITGAAGSIGSEMVRQIAVYRPAKLVLIDQAETPLHDVRLEMKRRWPEVEAHTLVASISNPTRMEAVFKVHRPDYVFHAAAYKHVPMMEDNPSESIQNNIYGTRVMADLAVKYGTKKFVMVSTDKAVNPTNVMGCSKRICEIYVQSLDKAIKDGKVKGVTQFVTTRFGNVLGSNGSVIPLFREQI